MTSLTAMVTATAAVKGTRQQSATTQDTGAIRADSGNVRPEKRKVGRRIHDPEHSRNDLRPEHHDARSRPRSAPLSRQLADAASGAVCAGSNPAGGAPCDHAKCLLTSADLTSRVSARVQPHAAESDPKPGFPEHTRNGPESIGPGQPRPRASSIGPNHRSSSPSMQCA
jgi:hypothetical protein